MSINIRYRLIQVVEILLWVGLAAGLGQIASRLWNMRDQGWRAMLDVAVPGLLGIGAGMAALIVLIGIYHNTRRQGEALDRLAKQGAGGMRRLPGAARHDAAQMAGPASLPAAPPNAASRAVFPPQPAPAATSSPAPVATSSANPVVSDGAPALSSAPVIPHAEPVTLPPDPGQEVSKPIARPQRAGARRLGPAS
ncbi:MAG: hypothetical protein DI616_06305 [Paracoccus denitrificans]|uniref:Uncharacterized protein n=1 Tax=Paracoccus denitrificans TaxID=266 RepID=A0A533I9T1_PARDE|nr:MAG: hypothetical protein DI616_06305 [Paracoccus denitrificans]